MRTLRLMAVGTTAPLGVVAALVLARSAVDRLGSALDAPVPEPALVAVAQLLAAVSGGWLALGTVCILLADAQWGGSGAAARLARSFVPRCWRAVVLAAVGTGLLTGPALTSVAASAGHAPGDRHPGQPGANAVAVLDGLALPDRASGGWHRESQPVVVSRGDCLWSLVAVSLPKDATNATIARLTERWYVANADVIGANPDLLLPGMRLHAPQPAAAGAADD